MTFFWRVAVAAAALTWAQLSIAVAQDWPTKPVRIFVGFGAGGGTDIVARLVADRLSTALGQQFVVENRPGAGGTIAGGVVAKAEADGYTALAISTGHSVSAVTFKQVPYDPVKSFAPIGIVASSAYVVAVPKSSPATDLKSLVEHVNKAGGKLNYSTVNVGSTQHLIAEDVRQRTGMDAKHLSFRTTGEVVTALLRGDAAFAVELYPRRARPGGCGGAAPDCRLDAPALAVGSQHPDAGGERPCGLWVQRLVWARLSGRHAAGHRREGAQGPRAGAGPRGRAEEA